MIKKTDKQKRQEAEYAKRMRGKDITEQLFGSVPREGPVQKSCSKCGNSWAWYSADSGKSWQCQEHRIR